MFLRYVEILLIVVVIVVFATQVFIPLWRGTPLFPYFRKEGRLNARLKEDRQSAVESDLEAKLNREKENS